MAGNTRKENVESGKPGTWAGDVDVDSVTVVHWIGSTPITKPAEGRGLMCGALYTEGTRASSYLDQVTCKVCLQLGRKG